MSMNQTDEIYHVDMQRNIIIEITFKPGSNARTTDPFNN